MSKTQIFFSAIMLIVLLTLTDSAYGQLDDIEDIEEYFGISQIEEDFLIFTDPSRIPITHTDAIQIFGVIPNEISARKTVVFLNVTYPDGKIIELKTLTNDKGKFYIPYILEKEDRTLKDGIYTIIGKFENTEGIFSANSGFLVFDPAMQDPTKKVIRINEGSAAFDCKRKDECFNPSTQTIEKPSLIVFQNLDNEAHYINGLDEEGKVIFSTEIITPHENKIINTKRLDQGAYYIYCIYHPWLQGALKIIEPLIDDSPEPTFQAPVSKKIIETVNVDSFVITLESDHDKYSMGNIATMILILNQNTEMQTQLSIYGPNDFIKFKQIHVDKNTGIGFVEFFIDSSFPDGEYIAKISFSRGIDRINLSTGFTVIQGAENNMCKGDQSLCFGGKVNRIVDGNTLIIADKKIRLSLINTPEKDESGFVNATDFTKRICPQNSLAFVDVDDKQIKDKYGRTVGVVLCNEKNLNEELLENNQAEIVISHCGKSEFVNSTWAQKFGCEGVEYTDTIDTEISRLSNPLGFDLGGGCLIATATYGTELAPQVQQLRELRNNVISTKAGAGFMNGFNVLYYSFSPAIADMERENPAFRETVKIGITPMLAVLSILNYVSVDTEIEIIVYGILVIGGITTLYLAAPGIIVYAAYKLKKSKKKKNCCCEKNDIHCIMCHQVMKKQTT